MTCQLSRLKKLNNKIFGQNLDSTYHLYSEPDFIEKLPKF